MEDQERDETIELSSDSSSDDEVDEENMGDEMAALASKVEDMGQAFGGSLTEREVTYLIQHEWAECAEDVVWRRSKLGIRLSKQAISDLDEWMQKNVASQSLQQSTEKSREL